MKHINKIKLSTFLDDEISESEKHCISEHLKSCHHCQKELKELSQVSDSLNLIEEVEVSPYFMNRLKQRILEREPKRVIHPVSVPRFHTKWDVWNGVHLPFLECVEWVGRIAVLVGATALFILSLLLGSHFGTIISQVKALQVGQEFNNLFSITLLDDLPKSSLGDAYASLLTKDIL